MTFCSYVIVGGGVAAVSCVEEIRAIDDEARIIVVSSSQLIKTVINKQKVISCFSFSGGNDTQITFSRSFNLLIYLTFLTFLDWPIDGII